jgi:hypothetical protein
MTAFALRWQIKAARDNYVGGSGDTFSLAEHGDTPS